jgi:crotonobetainyl-CoA:carnitine CoA-transferase CaiB-like acyl-CoA transferase
MDHQGAYLMATAVLAGLIARNRTGEGQWIDFSCTEAGIGFAGPELLDSTVNGRPMRRPGKPNSNADNFPAMAPHGIYPAAGDDSWVAIACRDDDDWQRLAATVDEEWARDPRWATFAGRMAGRDELDRELAGWTRRAERRAVEATLRSAGVPVAQVATPEDRIEHDPRTSRWNLWPSVEHDEIGTTRVEGLPVHLSETDWSIAHGAPCLGADNDFVYGSLLGLSESEIEALRERRVI